MAKRQLRALISAAVWSTASAYSIHTAQAAPVRCSITFKSACESTGCTTQTPAIYNTVDLARRTYARCDRNGCDTYEAQISRSGVFTVIDLPGRGVIAKLADNGSFVEVVTLGLSVLTSFGTCQ